MTYTGSQFVVSTSTPLVVESFLDASFTGDADDQAAITVNGGRYDFIIFDTTPRYLRAYIDVNGNSQFDPGEPFEIYNNKNAAPGDPIVPGPNQGGLDLTFGGTVTTSCIGDCNGDTFVTINELIKMVNIALNNADVSTCVAGDANHDTQITINEIIMAVNNTLNGCPGA